MNQAKMFDEIMMAIWDPNGHEHDFLATAAANKLRGTQRINPENACEVLSLVFPNAKSEPRLNTDAFDKIDLDANPLIFDVTFEDGSRSLIPADKYGCGTGCEYIDGPDDAKD